MQDARRVRVVNAGVKCHAFSPYVMTTTQNLEQITMIPNSYFYYVVDHQRLFPGYNVESSAYSIGRNDLSGSNKLKKWKIYGEPFTQNAWYTTTDDTYQPTHDQMALDLFNHPNFSVIKQSDKLNAT